MPRTGDGPFQRGERLTASRLNDLAKGVPVFMTGGTITESPTGKLINVDQPENIYIRLTGKTGSSPIKYAWKEVVRLANGTWLNTPRTANYTDDYAIELNNSNLSTTDNYVYRAERSPHSGEWLFGKSGLGNLTASSNSIIMILGTFDEYKNCPGILGVAGDPPKDSSNNLCVPAYAWAEYGVCGYQMKKIRDMRSFPYWAEGLNGGSASAIRRFYNAYFGDPAGGCAGVKFLEFSAGSSLSCSSCPTWLDSTKKCVKISFTTVARPCNAPSYCNMACTGMMYAMDQANAWGKSFSFTMCRSGCGFSFSGSTYTNPFNVNLFYEEIPTGSNACFWGPETFDYCNPCDGFGRWKFCLDFIPPTSPASGCDCGALVYFTNSQIKDLVVNCNQLSVPYVSCNKCVGTAEPYTDFDFIVPSSVKIDCCSSAESSACTGGGGIIGGGG